MPAQARPDYEAFRLRTFCQHLEDIGELTRHTESLPLADLASYIDGNRQAVLFDDAGGTGWSVAANVMGNRKRLSQALRVPEERLLAAVTDALQQPIDPEIVPRSDSPVYESLLLGDDVDLTRLPVHLQHAKDGGPYISAALDFTPNDKGGTNVGCRRLMLRGRRETGIDLIAPSDLRALYQRAVESGRRLPVAFAVGSHPVDYIGATSQAVATDEVSLIGGLRGCPVPLTECATIDAYAPADAEVILEGYIDPAGFNEFEGPYGEYLGYYGQVKKNPVYHVTAIARRRDALFQTASIGGRQMAATDTAQLAALRTESSVWSALAGVVREPVAVHVPASSGGHFNVRVAIRLHYPGEAANAIAAIFGSPADVKHVFIVDDDIDIRSDEQMDWALATRFQADRDLIVGRDFRAMPLDPSLAGRTGAKAGFDLTIGAEGRGTGAFEVPEPPQIQSRSGLPPKNVADVLRQGPATFVEMLQAAGAGVTELDVVQQLEELRIASRLNRLPDGQYELTD